MQLTGYHDIVETNLSAAQLDAWLPFAAVLELLPAALNSQLTNESHLTLLDFYVLQFLHDAEGQNLRLSNLAASTHSTLPRMSKVASRLEASGLVSRGSGDSSDGRALTVSLTADGARALTQATPAHQRTVRSLIIDVLSEQQVLQLRDIARALAARLHPDAQVPVDRQRSHACPPVELLGVAPAGN